MKHRKYAFAKRIKASQRSSELPAVELDVKSIAVPTEHRAIREKKMPGLIDSIAAIGLQNPISVRKVPDGYELVAGGHRLEAVKRSGRAKIMARILGARTSKIWAISENLHLVDARSMSTPTLADYAMKQIKRGRLNYDDILILPKTSDEVRSKPRILMPSDSQR
jgi:ParB-like chromosome segregation protein Spo0J